MQESISEFFRNLTFVDYLGLLTSLMIIVAYLFGGIFMVYNYFAVKSGKLTGPADPFYDPRGTR
jgi:hypothetical protein